MGNYLNGTTAFSLYKSESCKPYFVDKTLLLVELIPLVEQGNRHICLTRPRRFGKTVMANMVGAFFGKGVEGRRLFDSLKIAQVKGYSENLNQRNVIYIDFSKMPKNCVSYEQYISRIENQMIKDLVKEYPDADINVEEDTVWDALL